ncbi:MAG: hypothetical protein ACRD8A_00470 [Candidatus Acidiferrales bacterium]
MRSVVGLLVAAGIALLGYKVYLSKAVTGTGANAGPTQTIDVTGVKMDLLSIAQAERMYQAEHGSYASMDDLISSGALNMKKSGRDGYTYDIKTGADGFQVTASCPSTKFPGCSDYSVDQTMEVEARQ